MIKKWREKIIVYHPYCRKFSTMTCQPLQVPHHPNWSGKTFCHVKFLCRSLFCLAKFKCHHWCGKRKKLHWYFCIIHFYLFIFYNRWLLVYCNFLKIFQNQIGHGVNAKVFRERRSTKKTTEPVTGNNLKAHVKKVLDPVSFNGPHYNCLSAAEISSGQYNGVV